MIDRRLLPGTRLARICSGRETACREAASGKPVQQEPWVALYQGRRALVSPRAAAASGRNISPF